MSGHHLRRVLDNAAVRMAYAHESEHGEITAVEVESEACTRICRGYAYGGPEYRRNTQGGDLLRIVWSFRRRIAGTAGFGIAIEREPEPVQWRAFLTTRREPDRHTAEYARTCAEIAGHLVALADQCDAVAFDDTERGRWPQRLPYRLAAVARERAAVWRAMAAVAAEGGYCVPDTVVV